MTGSAVKSVSLDELVVCPHDRASCNQQGAVFVCSECRTEYPFCDGYVDFLASDHDFYEGKYCNEIKINPPPGLLRELPLWLLVHGYVWAVRKWVQPGSKVVELGCAAGVRWFGRRNQMIGLDFSRPGLSIASADYRMCLRADALHLPIPSKSVDAVVSACFFEHIEPADKHRLLAEVRRVLKPGGKVIFQYDIYTENPMIAAYRRRNAELYAREFLDNDGHIGYQTLDENDAIFRENGFKLLSSVAMERLPLQHASVWSKLGAWPGLPGRTARIIARVLGGKMILPNIALLRMVDETVGRLAPRRWGRIALTVAERLPDHSEPRMG